VRSEKIFHVASLQGRSYRRNTFALGASQIFQKDDHQQGVPHRGMERDGQQAVPDYLDGREDRTDEDLVPDDDRVFQQFGRVWVYPCLFLFNNECFIA
jgi:hypothetical protein